MVWQSSVGSKLAELRLKIEGAKNWFSSGLILKIIKKTVLTYPKNFFSAKTLYLLSILIKGLYVCMYVCHTFSTKINEISDCMLVTLSAHL